MVYTEMVVDNILSLTFEQWCNLLYDSEEYDVVPDTTASEFIRSLDDNIVDVRVYGNYQSYEIEFIDSCYKTWFMLKWLR